MKKQSPSISVCMPFYNVEDYIEEAIDSVLEQSFQNFELILINDGSTDDSLKIVQSYSDKRIRIINKSHDYITSLNAGLKSASGKYVARMDADDKMHKDRLQKQYNYLESNDDVSACGAGLEFFGMKGGQYIPTRLKSNEIEIGFIECNCFTVGMIRKSFLETHQLCYNRNFIYAEDYKLWVDIILAGGKLSNLPCSLYYYRAHEKQISAVNECLMHDNSYLIRNDLIRYLLNRDKDTYKNIIPVCDLLYDLYTRKNISNQLYCNILSALIKA